ncbi:MGMT family protein [Glutamicibacter sp. MNS18]|uniref:MGMT family protein n=1 Tax=Glutamicibacter sp. MNS18 TaxID=2989817 RepID=UPI0022366A13|nr:MGMT family protein [Glutamicibacter sp. MNS18]MCW4464360.1 MGMT family protein [Glutamicibacter sp. MNS18]
MYPPTHPGERSLDFTDAVHRLAQMIPSGQVLSYGDIAELLGTGGARQVGKAMQLGDQDVPWWRVIRADGLITESLLEAAQRAWDREATARRGRRVDMTRARWQPDPKHWADIEQLARACGSTKLSGAHDGMGP